MQLQLKLALIAPLLIAGSLAAQTRPLTRAEVADAIQTSLAANGFSTAQPLLPDDVSFHARVSVNESHPNLNVTRFESRSGSLTTQVALWNASEPRIPPFWVTIDRQISTTDPRLAADHPNPDETTPLATKPRETSVHYVVHEPIQVRNTSGVSMQPPLVKAGKPIRLIVQGSGMRITAKATALEAGREGQRIRVQCEPAGKILVAKIISAEIAEIDY